MKEATEYIYSFSSADYFVMIGYLLMLISVGVVLKKMVGNVKDYFVGGNKIPWWLAGASCFMMSFSAWTFTGAAGFAYKNGMLIVVLFFFNVIAFVFCAFFIAAKCRQTRKISYLEIVRSRFGRITEQFFLWIQVPLMLFGGAIWLVGLATFFTVAFGIPMQLTIIFAGIVILFYSTLSGSWGVMTTDFLQSVILMALSTTVAILTLIKMGGVGGFVNKVSPDKLQIISEQHGWMWIVAYLFQIFLLFNSITGAPRYLAVKDGKSACKAALLAAVLFLVGPLIWFVPPIAASHFFPDIGQILPELTHPQDAAYVLIGLEVLPSGLAGLLMMMIFAATLSSMDTAINQNAAIISMNLYKPLLRPDASEKEQFIAARVINVLLGVIVVVLGLIFARQKEMALFDLMLFLQASVVLPIAVPLFLIYWFKKTSPQAAILSASGGMLFSFVAQHHLLFSDADACSICKFLQKLGISGVNLHQDWPLSVKVFGVIVVSTALYFVTMPLWKRCSKEYRKRVDDFYYVMNKPVDVEREVDGSEDVRQFTIVGTLAIIVGIGVLLLLFIPSASLLDRMAVLLTGAMILTAGLVMFALGRKARKNAASKQKSGKEYVVIEAVHND